jgi:hypothetical protein
MRDKPIKHGYKIWMLCDESCYNLNFQVYTGKIGNKTETGLGQRVVLDQMSGMEGRKHIVFMNNYFSSHELFKKLKERNSLLAMMECVCVQMERRKRSKFNFFSAQAIRYFFC